MPREEWTAEELEHIQSTPRKWARKRKLTDEQVKEIRRRVDSLSVPWTIEGLAQEFGVTPSQISYIARRKRWSERTHEPENRPYWRAAEIAQMLGEDEDA